MKTDWKLAATVCLAVSLFSPLWAEDEPMKVSRADAMSAATTKPSPSYPAIAKQLKVEGEVQVQVLIGEEGKVEGATAVAGNPILAKAAMDTVKDWKFAPFKSNGKTVKAQAVLSFMLQDVMFVPGVLRAPYQSVRVGCRMRVAGRNTRRNKQGEE